MIFWVCASERRVGFSYPGINCAVVHMVCATRWASQGSFVRAERKTLDLLKWLSPHGMHWPSRCKTLGWQEAARSFLRTVALTRFGELAAYVLRGVVRERARRASSGWWTPEGWEACVRMRRACVRSVPSCIRRSQKQCQEAQIFVGNRFKLD